MKNLSWIWVLLAPIFTLLFPAIGNPDVVLEGLLTGGGYIALITLITEAVKPLLHKWKDYKFFGEVTSLVVALALGYGGFFFKYGIFEHATWYYTVGFALIGWIASNRWYDVTLGEPAK